MFVGLVCVLVLLGWVFACLAVSVDCFDCAMFACLVFVVGCLVGYYVVGILVVWVFIWCSLGLCLLIILMR